MQFIQHTDCTHVLGAPAGVPIEECRALPIRRSVIDGRHAVQSFWVPDHIELAALNAGHAVVLTIWGTSHCPVMLEVSGKPK